MTGHVAGRRKADYLACSRSVIIEQKSIDHDVDAKVRAFLGDLTRAARTAGRRANVRLPVSSMRSRNCRPAILSEPRLRAILTQRIDDYLAEADKQTRDTRLTFSIPTAVGVVVILNEHAQLIEPDYFVDKAWDMLRKEVAPGKTQIPRESGRPSYFRGRTVSPQRMAAR